MTTVVRPFFIFALMLLVFGICITAPRVAAGASFDCKGILNPNERLICDNPTISAKDDEFASLFQDVRKQIASQGVALNDFIAESRSQLKKRQACGINYSCVSEWYDERIRSLKEIQSRFSVSASPNPSVKPVPDFLIAEAEEDRS